MNRPAAAAPHPESCRASRSGHDSVQRVSFE
jgi:hypothetical protein